MEGTNDKPWAGLRVMKRVIIKPTQTYGDLFYLSYYLGWIREVKNKAGAFSRLRP